MDRMDIEIIEALQLDSRLTVAEIGERIGLSSSACHRRITALDKAGIITGYGARVDPEKLGLMLHAFIEIRLNDQTRRSMDSFEGAVREFDDILECHLTTGEADYWLSVAASDLREFDDIHRNYLSRLPNVSSMTTKFLIRRVKPWKGYSVRRRSH